MDAIKVFHIMTGGLQREGISSTQLEFFKHLDLKKNIIYIAAVHDNSSDMIKEYKKLGCTVILFPDRKKKTLRYFIALIRELRRIKPDIVHVHGSSAIMCIDLLASKFAGVKVRIAHSRNTRADQAMADKFFRPIFNCLFTDGLACGKEAGDWLFKSSEFTVIHNGKDFRKFRYNACLREKQRENDNLQRKIVIGHVGTFNYQKNHEYLINVFNEFQINHENAVLYLLGTGPLFEKCKKQVNQLGLQNKVIFAASVSNAEVAVRLQAMDIMVFPSRFEGLPNVVLEWQAEGLPCLISDKITKECAPSDLVEFASVKSDPVVWAKKIEQMLVTYTDREEQSKRGIQALKKNGFDITDAAGQLEKIYIELVQH